LLRRPPTADIHAERKNFDRERGVSDIRSTAVWFRARTSAFFPETVLAAAFADISFAQLSLIAAVAIFASLVGGVAGYGTGALMPLVLVPIVGAEPVVPIIAISALFTNFSRAVAFMKAADFRRALIVVVAALPTSALGAWGYTTLTGKGALLVIGGMMALSVPLRRFALHLGFRCSDRGLAVASFGWGVIVGGTSGAGIILLSLLMAAGLQGAAVIATDAAVSIAIGVVKIAVFDLAGAVSTRVVAIALLIGLSAFPGAFLAKIIVERLPLHIHTAILDSVVVFGGTMMIFGALR
jgi:uncharacterized membrane protein YfcA